MKIETYPSGKFVEVKATKEKGIVISKRLDLVKGYSVIEGEYTVLCRSGKYLKTEEELLFITENESKELRLFLMGLLLWQ